MEELKEQVIEILRGLPLEERIRVIGEAQQETTE